MIKSHHKQSTPPLKRKNPSQRGSNEFNQELAAAVTCNKLAPPLFLKLVLYALDVSIWADTIHLTYA